MLPDNEVSIHAPLRGATDGFFALIHALSVSIHAPLRGATCLNERCNPAPQFQSTHPCGVRLCPGHIPHPQKAVSIHAPLRGATKSLLAELEDLWFQSTHPCGVRREDFQPIEQARERFNPRTPAGCDTCSEVMRMELERFNPRTPAGCDYASFMSSLYAACFNPRTPAGCDSQRPSLRRW